jgi:hypothetical protein
MPRRVVFSVQNILFSAQNYYPVCLLIEKVRAYLAFEQIAQILHGNVVLINVWHKIWTLFLKFTFHFLLKISNLLYKESFNVNSFRISQIYK